MTLLEYFDRYDPAPTPPPATLQPVVAEPREEKPPPPRPHKRRRGGPRRLTWEDVTTIRREAARGRALDLLATVYRVSVSHVRAVVRGSTWEREPPPGLDGSDLGTWRVLR